MKSAALVAAGVIIGTVPFAVDEYRERQRPTPPSAGRVEAALVDRFTGTWFCASHAKWQWECGRNSTDTDPDPGDPYAEVVSVVCDAGWVCKWRQGSFGTYSDRPVSNGFFRIN